MSSLTDLDRRLSRKLDAQRGIQLTAEDLDLLVMTGAYEVFRKAVAKHQREICLHRKEESRSTRAATTISSAAPIETPSKSSGMTPLESANEALARAQRISTKDVLRSIGSS